jgi:DNA mismatch endonuclease (patch repair protein)
MTDVHTPERRSKNMQAIRHKDTKPEIFVRHRLHGRGFRFRLHVKDLPGKPDIVLPKYKAAIFVNGCFWHGHKCYLFKLPHSRQEFWLKKIDSNRARDERNRQTLKEAGWRTLIVWECAIKGRYKQAEIGLLDSIEQWIKSGNSEGECDHNHLP